MLWHNKTDDEMEQYSVRIKAANSSFVSFFCLHEIKRKQIQIKLSLKNLDYAY